MHSTTILTFVGVMGWVMACASDGASGEGEKASGSGGAAQGGAGQGGTSANAPPVGPVVADIDTASEATETCAALAKKLNLQNHQRLVVGRCAVEGLIASANGTASCSSVSASCISNTPPALGSPNRCTPKDFPACNTVTIAEFVGCSAAIVDAGAAYYGYFTCASELSALEAEMQTPVECEGPFARCPAFAKFW